MGHITKVRGVGSPVANIICAERDEFKLFLEF